MRTRNLSKKKKAFGSNGLGRSIFYYSIPLVLIIGLGAWGRMLLRKTPTPSPEEQTQNALNDIRKRSTYIDIQPSHLIFTGNRIPQKQFMLAIGKEYANVIYLFKEYEYTIETGGDPSKITTSGLCDLISQIEKREDPIAKILREINLKAGISFPIGSVGGNVEVEKLQTVLVEILYAIKKLSGLESFEAQVFIRGYADGQMKDWIREQNAERYHYERFSIVPSLEPGSPNPLTYSLTEVPIDIPVKYNNTHLPDLRAKFVKEVLVEPFLQECEKPKKIETHILKGYDFTERNPLDRKVQIFIALF